MSVFLLFLENNSERVDKKEKIRYNTLPNLYYKINKKDGGTNMKRTLCLLLSFLMLMSLATFPAAAVPAADEGLRFDASTIYQMSQAFASTPRTFETWLQIDSDAKGSDAPGGILGKIACNQGTGKDDNFCLRILASGDNFYIRLFWRDTSGSTTNFTGHYIPKGEKVHVAVTTTTSSVSLYINGVLKETKSANVINVHPGALAIGGSFHAGNTYYLKKTQMYSFAMYSDARTAAEIVSDMNGTPDTNDSSLLVSYDLTASGVERLKDHSKNANHLDCFRMDEFSYMSEVYPGNELASEGFRFNWVDSYSNASALAAAPKTMEISVNLRKNSSPNVVRTLFSNGTVSLQAYHMQAENQLGIRYKDGSGTYDWWFNPSLATGDWAHITVVRDGSSVLFYLNGSYVKSMAQKSATMPTTAAYSLGCSPSAKTTQVLYDGKIGNVAFYSDVRTAEEIAKDAAGGAYKNPDKDNLLFAYDLRSVKQEEVIDKVEDLSNNNNDLKITKKWTPGPVSKGDYAYSFAVIGDPQIVTYNDPELMVDMYRWIAENKEEKNIQYVINLGDNTDKDKQVEEWNYVMEAFRVLDDADIPYIINRGNHDDDYRFNWNLNGNNRWNAGPQNPGCGYKDLIGDNYQYVDDYGPENGYTTGGQPCYENAYYELKVGDVYYLIFALDYGARDDSLNWAGEIIAQHPHHNVIITTHNYLNQDGTLTYNNGGDDRSQTTTGSLVGTLPSIQNKATYDKDPVEGSRVTSDGLDYNDGREIWEKLISKHDNIVMVLSGHVATNGDDALVKTVRTRENGTQVVEMMVNPQGIDAEVCLTGMVAMLYFSEDGTQMEVEWYSTAKNAFYNAHENHFTETLSVEPYAHKYVDGVCKCGDVLHICTFDQKVEEDRYLVSEASCNNAAVYYLSCVCGEHGEDVFSAEEVPGHDHGDWQTNEEKHWHKCSVCGTEENAGDHDYDDSWDKDCNTCGYERECPVLGDANGDGVKNSEDIQRIYQHLSTREKMTEEQLKLADANQDGDVNFSDIQKIYKDLSASEQ